MLTIRQAPRSIARRRFFEAVGRLIDADRRADYALDRRQPFEIVRGHWLFEHQEVVLVEFAKKVDVGCRVRGVRVDHQRNIAEVLTDRGTSARSHPGAILIFTRRYPASR